MDLLIFNWRLPRTVRVATKFGHLIPTTRNTPVQHCIHDILKQYLHIQLYLPFDDYFNYKDSLIMYIYSCVISVFIVIVPQVENHQWKTLLLPGTKSIRVIASPNKDIFRVTGPLWGESTGLRWIPLAKASDAVLWYFLWSAPEQTVEQTIMTPVFWDVIALIMTSL